MGTLNNQTTHNTRQRVFLCVMPVRIRIMVGQVGQLQSWPVSFGAGSSNPAWAITK
ncbi:TPA: ash family protein [Citrobacter freundii]|nr:ash family protein [Citrobacter freundii]HCJ7736312.1 ash family protein [Citrobacter freundii]